MSVRVENGVSLPQFIPGVHTLGYIIKIADEFYISNGSRWVLLSTTAIATDRTLAGAGTSLDLLSNNWSVIYESVDGAIGLENTTGGNITLRLTDGVYNDGDIRFVRSTGGALLQLLPEVGETYTITGLAQLNVADGEVGVLQYDSAADDWVLIGGNLSSVSGSGAANRLAYWSDANTLAQSGNFRINGGALILGNQFATRGSELDIWANAGFTFASVSTAGVMIGDDGGSILLELPGLNGSFPGGFAIDGFYDGGTLDTITNLTAYGSRSGGGYGGRLNIRTSDGLTITDRLTFYKDGSIVQNSITGPQASALTPVLGMEVVVSSTDGVFTSVGKWGYNGTSWINIY
jgi:hypothetical protein